MKNTREMGRDRENESSYLVVPTLECPLDIQGAWESGAEHILLDGIESHGVT